ncbi:LysR family transcriptional regulator [Duganella sp. LX20W]|uniref:LysR family transcriptional regulator n=1 Tax=Rugamonas brunnea TaxID=2758569 RepID=A0A7W2ERU8_9BURK|nr:LysR family transcriptional regulator [Rugamonas brunnea]MBA5637464.1 LysR family transcriptional regulator [Rugamonas brunnea]
MDRLEALKVFCAVVETGAFARAAQRLGVSTSSVTNQVAALEAHFQVRLLNRTTRSMSLTDEGRRCYEQALRLVGDMGELESSLRESAQTPSGTLRVDLPGILARLYLAPALPRFLAAYPDLTLKVTASDRMIDMTEEGVDVLVRIGTPQDTGLVAKTVGRTAYVTCASSDFLQRHGTPSAPDALADYACLNFLSPKSRQVRPWLFQRDGAVFPATPAGRVAMDHVDTLVEAAMAGAGIVQHLSVSLREPLRSGALVPVLQAWQAPGPDIVVIFPPRHLRAAKVNAFVAFAAQLFG